MQNLKIKVANESESKEAQGLFFELGYVWTDTKCQTPMKYTAPVIYSSFEDGDLCCDKYYVNPNHKEITLAELRDMVVSQHSNDEPFLTPECTLNDQYAEIEQVRQAIKVKSGSDSDHSLDAMSFGFMGLNADTSHVQQQTIEATLAERGSRYGEFESVAETTRALMHTLADADRFDELSAAQYEALHMICSKMARIVNGDPDYADNWHDIAGYAKLVEDII